MFHSAENVGDLFDLLILKQSEEKEAGEEQAGKLTDTHIVQIVMDLLIGTDNDVIFFKTDFGLA